MLACRLVLVLNHMPCFKISYNRDLDGTGERHLRSPPSHLLTCASVHGPAMWSLWLSISTTNDIPPGVARDKEYLG